MTLVEEMGMTSSRAVMEMTPLKEMGEMTKLRAAMGTTS